MKLTLENYKKGFLVSNGQIGGVAEMAEGVCSAYVSDQVTGETLYYQEFESVEPALVALNQMEYDWTYETISGGGCGSGSCGTGACGTGGGCGAGKCGAGGCG